MSTEGTETGEAGANAAAPVAVQPDAVPGALPEAPPEAPGVPLDKGDSERRIEDVSSAIYGAVVVTALMAVIPETEHPALGLLTLVATVVIYWIAHVFAGVLARRYATREPTTVAGVAGVARHTAPLMWSAVPPGALLVLAATGIIGRRHAYDYAMLIGVAVLFGWGFVLARREGAGWGGRLLTGALTATLAFFIVVLETFLA